jgi:hypothetical protein
MAALEPAPAGVTVPDELYQAAKRDAEEAEAYAAELEAKLAKAVKGAFVEGFLARAGDGWVNNPHIEDEWRQSRTRATLAELKGEKDE